MHDEDFREYLASAYNTDDLVNLLEIDIDTLIDLLWSEIENNRDKFDYLEELKTEEE